MVPSGNALLFVATAIGLRQGSDDAEAWAAALDLRRVVGAPGWEHAHGYYEAQIAGLLEGPSLGAAEALLDRVTLI